MTDLKELRAIAEAAEGTTRINWSPEDALELLQRVEDAERMVREVVFYASDASTCASRAVVHLQDIVGAETKCREKVGAYVSRYYPGESAEYLWPT